MFIASSSEDRLDCLGATDGRLLWTYYASAPLRLAPSVVNGRAYLGGDDGYVVCLAADMGEEVWRFDAGAGRRWLPGNGRVISEQAIRTGVLVQDGVVHLLAGLFPSERVEAFALNAEDGSVLRRRAMDALAPQGYLLASATRLFVPTGRTTPGVLDLASGDLLGMLPGQGGAWALLCGEELIAGPGRTTGALDAARADTRETIASYDGLRMVVRGDTAIIQTDATLRALSRTRAASGEPAVLWEAACADNLSLALAGDAVIAGGAGRVSAYDPNDGGLVWSAEVEGAAYGLAVADSRLYVTTDAGLVYCFAAGRPAEAWAPEALRMEARLQSGIAALDVSIGPGYALFLGEGAHEVAASAVDGCDAQLVVRELHADGAKRARVMFGDAGLLGHRVSVHTGERAPLPYTSLMFNTVVCTEPVLRGRTPTADEVREMVRVTRPYGGVTMVIGAAADAAIGRALASSGVGPWRRKAAGDTAVYTHERGPLPGAGEWTGLYADPGNTACSGDELRAPFAMQWFGEPGPQPMVDRHNRATSSLVMDGRLIIPGEERIMAVDAYSGAPLWDLTAPGFLRPGALRAGGNMVIHDSGLYALSGDECWRIDPATGSPRRTYHTPEDDGEWGWLGVVDGLVLGTAAARGAAYDEVSRETIDLIYGDDLPLIYGTELFALDQRTGRPLLRWAAGSIPSGMVAADGDAVYLVACEAPADGRFGPGRATAKELFGPGARLVAVSLHSLTVLWEQAVDLPFEQMAHLQVAGGVVLASGTRNEGVHVRYDLCAFSAGNGAPLWVTHHVPGFIAGGTHGEQDQHPVIIGETVVSRPSAFNLRTGAQLDYRADRGGHGCGGLTGSAAYLYGRGDNPRYYPLDVPQTTGVPLTTSTRPGCWLNIIPAGGLVLIPESSSGCTCGFPIQTSLAMIPVAMYHSEARIHPGSPAL